MLSALIKHVMHSVGLVPNSVQVVQLRLVLLFNSAWQMEDDLLVVCSKGQFLTSLAQARFSKQEQQDEQEADCCSDKGIS